MSYVLNTPDDQQEMLAAIGVGSIDDLVAAIPRAVRLDRPLELPPAMSELELASHLEALAGAAGDRRVCFLGAGSYDHFIPAVVDHLAGRSEFYTAYTPYQPEASQGSLQAFFEYQTLICQLTGMDVSNASLYEGASALAEAVLMAMSATGRRRLVIAEAVHPEYRQVLATYLANVDSQVETVDFSADGTTSPAEVGRRLDDQTAAVVFSHPNFFGCLEPAEALVQAAHDRGALAVAVVDPISLGLLKRPGQYGADIVVAEGQSLGIPMSFGGPYLGILAARQELVRRMPGRLVGQTTDRFHRRAFVLTLQTREQHIRRAKATSNICTNQGLMALRATVYLAVMGPAGLRAVADLCARKARYLVERLSQVPGYRRRFGAAFLREFVLQGPGPAEETLERLDRAGIAGGVALGRFWPALSDCLLVAVTEKRTREEMDRYVAALSGA